jgi:diaminopimelate decarboxylase
MNLQHLQDYLHSHAQGHSQPYHQPVCAYLYDLEHLRRRADMLRRSLPSQCMLFYAIKANSDEPILKALLNHTDGFEVASLGEILRVRAIDDSVPIVFGGPCKSDIELEGALSHRVALIHVESEHQLRRLNWIARHRDEVADILIRVNPAHVPQHATLRMGGQATQFGIEEAQVPSLLELIQTLSNINLRGLHIHAISNNLDANTHLALVKHYFDLAEDWQQRYTLKFEWLNVGGGIGVNYADPNAPFDWENFCDGLARLVSARQPGFKIVFECGRFLAADCGCYISEVVDIKSVYGKHFAILRGGSHHFRLPVSWQHNHPFLVLPRDDWHYPFSRPAVHNTPVTLCGELCTPKDTLAREVHVESLRAGDRIVFLLAGAYGWHISHHDFLSHPHPERLFLDN